MLERGEEREGERIDFKELFLSYIHVKHGYNISVVIRIYLNSWSPAGATVWEGLGDVVLLEMCHCGQALRFQKPIPPPVSPSFCLVLVDMSSQLLPECLLPNAKLSIMMVKLRNCEPKLNSFFYKLPWQ